MPTNRLHLAAHVNCFLNFSPEQIIEERPKSEKNDRDEKLPYRYCAGPRCVHFSVLIHVYGDNLIGFMGRPAQNPVRCRYGSTFPVFKPVFVFCNDRTVIVQSFQAVSVGFIALQMSLSYLPVLFCPFFHDIDFRREKIAAEQSRDHSNGDDRNCRDERLHRIIHKITSQIEFHFPVYVLLLFCPVQTTAKRKKPPGISPRGLFQFS